MNAHQQRHGESAWVRWLRVWVARRLVRPEKRSSVRRLAAGVVKLDRIGDAVLAIGAVRLLTRRFGEANCLLVISPQAEAIFAAEFPAAQRLVLPMAVMHRQLWRRGAEWRRQCTQYQCDEVISLRHHREDWDEIVPAWLGGSTTWQLDPAQSGPDFSPARTFTWGEARRIVFDPPGSLPDGLCRELERHRQLLSAVLGRQVAPDEILPRCMRPLLPASGDFVLVTPFSSMAIRDFPRGLLLAAVQTLRRLAPVPLRFYGDRNQRPRLEALAAEIRSSGVDGIEVVTPADAGGFAEAVAAARFVLSVDTAAAHLATAFDRPAVVLMGRGHPEEFVPWGAARRQLWLTHDVECRACDWHCRQPEPYCLTRVATQALVEAVERYWIDSGKTGDRPDGPRA